MLTGLGGWSTAHGVHTLTSQQVLHATVEPSAPEPELAAAPDVVSQPVRIRRGTTFSTLVQDYGLPGETLRRAALDLYDLSTIRPDRELVLTWTDGEARPHALAYAIDSDRTLVVERDGEDWTARVDEVQYTSSTGSRAFRIERSLWQDGLDAGLRPGDLARLATVFEYELDFNTELRAGASFAVAAEVLEAPDRKPRLGDIHAVRLVNGERSWTAIRHEAPDGSDGWYQPDGTSMRKPFLRSPLEFSRVTSGFNPKRFHPVLKRRRPHNGTDFGAPTGTPVRAVADGVVVRAGWAGGHGRFVKVDHEGPYETSYSHLSAISVKQGQRIQQGQLVGRVGASGLATGPHLHFQMWKDGRYVDAMKIDLPNQAPLLASQKGAFQEACDRWLPMLDEASRDAGIVSDAAGE